MDRKPDVMRRLGVVGVCKEAYNILRLHVRLFLSLAVTLVLPVGLLIFCQGFVVDPLYDKMRRNAEEIRHVAQRYSRLGPDQWLEIIYPIVFVLVLVFSLLPTAAIVYTVASIYTAKGLSYAKVLSAVPKVLKRLFVTSFWVILLIFITNFTLYSIFVYFFVLAVVILA